MLEAGFPNATYLWQDSTTDSNYTVNQSGVYWVEVRNDCGAVDDTIIIII